MTLVIGATVFVALWLFFYSLKKNATQKENLQEPRAAQFNITIETRDAEQYKDRNELREQWLRQRYPQSDKLIFSKVVGVTFHNRNGSDRQKLIQRCTAGEELCLVPEPDNAFDQNAIAVCRKNGEQLGYLGRRLAEEMCRWMDQGEHWSAVLIELTGLDKASLGANIVLLRKNPGMDDTNAVADGGPDFAGVTKGVRAQ